MENLQATLDAIKLLRDVAVWCACEPIGQQLRTGAYLRLEREVRAYLTGKE